MDPKFIIDTIHERRAGIDMISLPFELETFYAEPDEQEGEDDTEPGGCQIWRSGGRGH